MTSLYRFLIKSRLFVPVLLYALGLVCLAGYFVAVGDDDRFVFYVYGVSALFAVAGFLSGLFIERITREPDETD